METVTIKERCVICLNLNNQFLELDIYREKGNICSSCSGSIDNIGCRNKSRREEIASLMQIRRHHNIQQHGEKNKSRTITIPLPAFIRDLYRKNEETKKELVKQTQSEKRGEDMYSTYGDDSDDSDNYYEQFIAEDDE